MPLYHFKCTKCETEVKRILEPKQQNEVTCKECGSKLERLASGPSTQVMEKLDNGAMGKSIERLADAQRLFAERSRNSTKEYKKSMGIQEE